jgi:DNA repair exonuclease SbcCD nuclease subunit
MSHSPFRFLHASDLHLERPLAGVTEAPDHLRSLFLEAPYQAAQRVFDAALQEQVDFVIFAGDVLDPALCGPRGAIFLSEQLRRLQERGSAVYWSGGRVDSPSRWPAELPLPENVRVFPQDCVEHVVHHRDGLPLCNLLGTSSARGAIAADAFRASPGSRLNIAVACGQADASQLKQVPVAYWALGGRHRSWTHTSPQQVAHYPGTPQGRRPSESGAHGCTLVEVDAAGQIHARPLPCDVARWHTLEVRVDEHTRRDQLEDLLRERLGEQRLAEGPCELLVSWSIVGSGPLWSALRRGDLAAELVHVLRREFGHSSPAAWSVGLTAHPPAGDVDIAAEQETLLGDFLRLVGQHQARPEEALDLSAYLERSPQDVPEGVWRLDDPATRTAVLREAAALGIELLEGGAV